ncbi:MAG: ABC transporter permease [Planctomycetota bacterium]
MSPRLFFRVCSIEARTRMSYRVDFWLNTVVGFFAQFGLVYFLWQAMFAAQSSAAIGGYSFDGMVAYYLAVILLGKLVRGREFEGAVSSDIYEGGLNRYIVFPAPYVAIKYAQHLGAMVPAVVQFVLFGVVLLLVMDVPPELTPTPGTVLLALGAAAAANLLHFFMSFPIQAVAFWADNVWSLEVAKRFVTSLLGGFMLPLSVFPGWAQEMLKYTPFPYLFSLPARALLGQVPLAEWGLGICVCFGWCCLFAILARVVWRQGQLQYTGIGI